MGYPNNHIRISLRMPSILYALVRVNVSQLTPVCVQTIVSIQVVTDRVVQVSAQIPVLPTQTDVNTTSYIGFWSVRFGS